LYICFIDYNKAFDSVIWNKLWEVLKEMGVPIHLIYLIRNLYENNTSLIKMENHISPEFKVKKGVRQGCILSPTLFNLYTECIMRRITDRFEGGINIGGRQITNLRYADDTTLLAGNIESLANEIQLIETESKNFGLTLNRSKTKIMIIDKQRTAIPNNTILNDIEVVDTFNYLGALINNNGTCRDEIKRRINLGRIAMNNLQKTWKDNHITKQTKLNLIKSLIFSIVLYGAETWTIKSREKNNLNAFGMWCYRKMLRISWTEKRTNQSIIDELGIKEHLSNLAERRILKYFGHIMRRNTVSLEKTILQGKIHGSRTRGRPPMRWLDQIPTLTKTPFESALRAAQNRSGWRQKIQEVTTLQT
jgi:hypothetical protein